MQRRSVPPPPRSWSRLPGRRSLASSPTLACAGLAFLAAALVFPANGAAASREEQEAAQGWLLLPQFGAPGQAARLEGLIPTWVFVTREDGAAIPPPGADPGWAADEMIPLPPGHYWVEVGHTSHPLNRWRYEVRANQVTLIRSGLVAVSAFPEEEQPPDACRPWSAQMWVHVTDAAGQPHEIAAAAGSEVTTHSILQLHEGTYRFLFNGLMGDLEVRDSRSVYLPITQVAPVGRRDFRLSMEQNEAADNPSITLCADRPTQVLAGKYWGSYIQRTPKHPFRERVWQEMELDPGQRPRYVRLRAAKVSRRVFTGPGSRPEPVRPPETPAAPAAPQGTEVLDAPEAPDAPVERKQK